MQKNVIISVIVTLILIGGVFYVASDNEKSPQPQNVEIRDGIQYVAVIAQGGYSPRVSQIQPNLPTKLIVRTNNTYDCSIALIVRSANFQKMLQPTGEQVIDLGTPKSGERIQGVCSMGMYGFQIRTN